MKNLTPQRLRCPWADCPSVHQIEIDGKPMLLIVGEHISDWEALKYGAQCDPKANESAILIDPAYFDDFRRAARQQDRTVSAPAEPLQSGDSAEAVTDSSGNVFADLGLSSPELRMEIARLTRENWQLKQALKPFEKALKWFEGRMSDEDMASIDEATHMIGCEITVADLRRARKGLEEQA